MPKMQGFWRPSTKIDEAEFESAKTRTAARLADLFGVDAPAARGDEPPAGPGDGASEPGASMVVEHAMSADEALASGAGASPPGAGAQRPPIIVDVGADLVGVMAESARVVPDLAGMNARPGGTMASGTSGDPVVTTDADPPSGRVAGAGRGPRRKAAADRTGSRRASASAQPSDPRGTRAGRAVRTRSTAGRRAAPVAAACPYCAVLLQPAPASSQRCARCRQRIVVKRVDGRAVYLTEAAVPVFQAERRRIASAGRFQRERARWLKLAAAAGAPSDRATRLAAAQLSEETLGRLPDALHDHRQARDPGSKARAAMGGCCADRAYTCAGPVPRGGLARAAARGDRQAPPGGTGAELRGIAEIARDAQLVAASCCDACRVDDGRVLRIAAGARTPRLPHDGCPKGLCRCRWELAQPIGPRSSATSDADPGRTRRPPGARPPRRPEGPARPGRTQRARHGSPPGFGAMRYSLAWHPDEPAISSPGWWTARPGDGATSTDDPYDARSPGSTIGAACWRSSCSPLPAGSAWRGCSPGASWGAWTPAPTGPPSGSGSTAATRTIRPAHSCRTSMRHGCCRRSRRGRCCRGTSPGSSGGEGRSCSSSGRSPGRTAAARSRRRPWRSCWPSRSSRTSTPATST